MAVGSLLTLGLHSAHAASDAWSTTPNDATFSGNNWTTGATVPGTATGTVLSGDSLYFGPSSITTLNDDEAAGFTFAGITFNPDAAAYTIAGNAFTLAGDITNSGVNLETINDAFSMAAPQTFTTTTGGGNLTLGGVISGAGGLTAAGSGTLTLSGLSSYTGGTTVSGGVLSANTFTASGSNSSIGTGALTLNGGTFQYTGASSDANDTNLNRTITVGANGGTLDIANGGFFGYGGAFAGSGTLTVTASNGNNRQLLYTGNSSAFTGNIVVGTAAANSGFVQYRSSTANAFGTGTVTVNAGGTFSSDNGGTNPTTLGNAFTLNGGLLATQAPNITYSGAVNLAATSSVGHTSNGTGTVTLSGVVSGAGGLNAVGGTTVTLSGANTYTGTTTVTGGTVLATTTLAANGSASGIGAGAGVTLNGGTLRYTGAASVGNFNRAISVGTSGGTLDNASGAGRFVFVSGSFSGTGALAFVDSSRGSDQFLVTGNNAGFSGNVTIGNGNSGSGVVQYRSNAANPFGTGTIQVNTGGVLTADNGSTVPNTLANVLTLSGGQLATQSPNMTYTGLITLAASSNSSVGSLTGYNGSITLGNVVAGSGGLTKINTDTAVLSVANTYSGGTTVNGGTLQLGNATALGSQTAALTVNSGVLDLNGNSQTVGVFSGSGGGQVSNSLNGSSAVLTIGSGTAAAATGSYAGGIADNAGGAATGTVALVKTGAGTETLAGASTFTGGTTISGGTLKTTASGALGNGAATLSGGTLQLASGGGGGSTANSSSAFTLNGGATNTGGVLTLTDGGGSEARSAFTTTAQTLNNTGGFTASFVYTPSGNKAADGVTFTIQNNAPTALGGSGGSLGYTGIANSGAVELNIYPNASGGVGTAFGVNGSIPTNQSVSFLSSGDPILVTLGYSGTTLTETLTDQTTPANTKTITYNGVDFQTLLGGTSGFVGFTGGTGGATAIQTISNFMFASNAVASQTYANALAVTANSTVNVTNALTATVGGLSIGANTLSVTSTDATASPYSLTAGATTLTGNATFSVANSAGGGAGTLALGAISGNANGVTKTGAGTLTLSGTSSYTGGTTVNAGTLTLANTGGAALTGGGAIAVNGASTLSLAAASQISGGSNLSLNTGAAASNATLSLNNNSATFGALTEDPATIDFGAPTGVSNTLSFANSSGQAWVGPLSISNYEYNFATPAPVDHLFFGTDSTGLTAQQLGQISFVNVNGVAGNTYNATMLSNGEVSIAPTPEPGGIIPILVGLAGTGVLVARRRRKAMKENCQNELAEAV